MNRQCQSLSATDMIRAAFMSGCLVDFGSRSIAADMPISRRGIQAGIGRASRHPPAIRCIAYAAHSADVSPFNRLPSGGHHSATIGVNRGAQMVRRSNTAATADDRHALTLAHRILSDVRSMIKQGYADPACLMQLLAGECARCRVDETSIHKHAPQALRSIKVRHHLNANNHPRKVRSKRHDLERRRSRSN